jgi:hypothetical protein
VSVPAAFFAAISRRSPLVSLAMIDGDLRRFTRQRFK